MICHYYLTYNCFGQCEYCQFWQKDDFTNINEASVDIITNNIKDMAKLGIKEIVFTGGEPLKKEGLEVVLEQTKASGMTASLITDGMLLPKKAKVILNNVDNLYISIDAPNEDENNRIRGVECYREAVDAISCAKFYKKEPIVNFTLTKYNIQFLPEMVEFAEKHSVFLSIKPVHHFAGHSDFEKISMDYVLRYALHKNVLLNRSMWKLLKAGGNNQNKSVCMAVDRVMTITPDDNLVLPCINAVNSKIPINGGLCNLINSEIVQGYKKIQGTLPECQNCCDSDYLVPSFSCRISEYWFLDKLSFIENEYLKSGKAAWIRF